IFSRNPVKPPHYISTDAILKNCCITEGCYINGTIEHSVLSEGVDVGDGAIIKDSVIMPNVKIGAGAVIEKTIIGPGAVIGEGAIIGVNEAEDNPYASPMCTDDIVLLQGGIILDAGTEVYKGSMVENDIVSENVLFDKASAAPAEAAAAEGGV
ncbi:MAG: hypothetical protein IJD83_05260, partial [Clostridia bacterium]|nr:hypothetical protein [Clostridia bacterium]